jgi:hypothetical protein
MGCVRDRSACPERRAARLKPHASPRARTIHRIVLDDFCREAPRQKSRAGTLLMPVRPSGTMSRGSDLRAGPAGAGFWVAARSRCGMDVFDHDALMTMDVVAATNAGA